MDDASEARYRELEPRFTNTTREKLRAIVISRGTVPVREPA
jgi:hypothetical protein